jgi:hypothetical protein
MVRQGRDRTGVGAAAEEQPDGHVADQVLGHAVGQNLAHALDTTRGPGPKAPCASVQAILQPAKRAALRNRTGHLHYFTKETALRALQDSGYQIVDHFPTAGALEVTHKPLRTRISSVPRWMVSLVRQDWSARLFGGFSLMVPAA